MARRSYYLMTSLPALPRLGEPPPVTLADLRDRAGDEPGAGAAVAAVLLEHDLLQRQGVLAGEIEQPDPVVLSHAQARGEEPLPEAFQGAQGDEARGRTVGDDAVWEAYFRFVAAEGRRLGVEFLERWVGFEVALRNALVQARAKALELPADDYVVAAELAEPDPLVAAIVAAWSAAGNPLAAQKALDQGRWDWLEEHGQRFSFRAGEAAAYARGLVLLHRWNDLAAQT